MNKKVYTVVLITIIIGIVFTICIYVLGIANTAYAVEYYPEVFGYFYSPADANFRLADAGLMVLNDHEKALVLFWGKPGEESGAVTVQILAPEQPPVELPTVWASYDWRSVVFFYWNATYVFTR